MLTDATATALARLGFACRGIVYILVGGLAVHAALQGGEAADNQGALASLASAPAAPVLLGIIAAGLFGYALWRFTEALAWKQVGLDARTTMKRAGHGMSAVAHLLLAWTALGLALFPRRATRGSPGDETARHWTSWLLDQPFGEWLVGGVAVCLAVGAAGQAKKAWRGDFATDLGGDTPAPEFACMMGRIGYAARALVFAILSSFFALAAWRARADQAGGVSDALEVLRSQPGGVLLMISVGLGLAVFGAFGLVEARYRRVRVSFPH